MGRVAAIQSYAPLLHPGKSTAWPGCVGCKLDSGRMDDYACVIIADDDLSSRAGLRSETRRTWAPIGEAVCCSKLCAVEPRWMFTRSTLIIFEFCCASRRWLFFGPRKPPNSALRPADSNGGQYSADEDRDFGGNHLSALMGGP